MNISYKNISHQILLGLLINSFSGTTKGQCPANTAQMEMKLLVNFLYVKLSNNPVNSSFPANRLYELRDTFYLPSAVFGSGLSLNALR